LPDGKENTVISFTRREPDTQLIAMLSGRRDDVLTLQRHQTQPDNCSLQKQDRCLPQKRGFCTSFDNTAEKFMPWTTVDNRFRIQSSDSKF